MGPSARQVARAPARPRIPRTDEEGLPSAGSSSERGGEARPREGLAEVTVHIYHCDSFTGFLNQAGLKSADMGIFHAGVEVYNEEWCFQYYEDTWEDPVTSGVNRCRPRRMPGYDYVESVSMGFTRMSARDVNRLLARMSQEWPASSYHITKRNCLSFAEELTTALRAPKPFPPHLKGILEASRRSASVDAVVDYSWSWLKWYMIRSTRQEQALREAPPAPAASPLTCASAEWLLGACSLAPQQPEQFKPRPSCPPAGGEAGSGSRLGGAAEVVLMRSEVAEPPVRP